MLINTLDAYFRSQDGTQINIMPPCAAGHGGEVRGRNLSGKEVDVKFSMNNPEICNVCSIRVVIPVDTASETVVVVKRSKNGKCTSSDFFEKS